MRIYFLTGLLLAGAQILIAQNKAEKMQGLLWEISGNGLPHKGYLYGTMHVSEKMAFNLSDTFFIALRQADVVALETDVEQWQPFTKNLVDFFGQSTRLVQSGTNESSGGSIDLYNHAFEFKSPSNQELGEMLSLRPSLSNEFLFRSQETRQEFEEDTYLDLFIYQAGKKLGKPVVGLEDIETSYEYVFRARIPDEDEEKNPRRYTGGYQGLSLEEAYRRQDLDLIDSLYKAQRPSKNFQKYMLDIRNGIMVSGIDSLLRKGQRVFAAVGAAHLPGETGIIKQLRAKGYTLRAIQFTDKAGSSDKEAIDSLRYPVKLSRQYSADSAWTVEAPGPLYQAGPNRNGQISQTMFVDMSNGAYYALYRIPTNAWWSGESPQYIQARIDSLIYEKIPGKIFERKAFSEPFPGHEIATRTRRGDVQRYKIFVTPTEIAMFTTGGNGDFALNGSAAHFIAGAQPAARSAKPAAFTPASGGFQILFPAPLSLDNTEDFPENGLTAASFDPADSSIYFITRTDYQDWKFIEEDSFELNMIGESLAKRIGDQKPFFRLLPDTEHPALHMRLRGGTDSAYYHLRLVIDGPRYYLMGCRSRKALVPDAFFDGFKVIPFVYPDGWKPYTDSLLRAQTVSIAPKLNPRQAFIDRLYTLLEKAKSQLLFGRDLETDQPDRHLILQAPNTGEAVYIHKYVLPKSEKTIVLDSLLHDLVLGVSQNKKMQVLELEWRKVHQRMVGTLMLGDTNSTRGIRVMYCINGPEVYRLMCAVNQLQAPGAFVSAVFEQFNPLDTLSIENAFEKPQVSFLENLYSADSALLAEALSTLRYLGEPEAVAYTFADFQRAVENPGFDTLPFSARERLMAALAYFEPAQAYQMLKKLSWKYRDSAVHRAAIIHALSWIPDKTAYQWMFRLWVEKPVYLAPYHEQIFANLRDSLPLTAQFVPILCQLAGNEYLNTWVLDLLLELSKNGLLKRRQMAMLRPKILENTGYLIAQFQYQYATVERNTDYVYDDYQYDYGYSGHHNIVRNLELLLGQQNNDPAARQMAKKAWEACGHVVKIKLLPLMLQQGLSLDELSLKKLATQSNTRYRIFRTLAESGHLPQYRHWFQDTMAIIESYLLIQGHFVSDERQLGENDSLRFVSKHPYLENRKPAQIYFFEVKLANDEDWRLVELITDEKLRYFTGADQAGETFQEFLNSSTSPIVQVKTNLDATKRAEYIRNKLGSLRFLGRERYVSEDIRPNYGWD